VKLGLEVGQFVKDGLEGILHIFGWFGRHGGGSMKTPKCYINGGRVEKDAGKETTVRKN